MEGLEGEVSCIPGSVRRPMDAGNRGQHRSGWWAVSLNAAYRTATALERGDLEPSFAPERVFTFKDQRRSVDLLTPLWLKLERR